MQQVPTPTHPLEETSSVPDPSAVQVTAEAFYALLEDVDLNEVFEEFIVPAKPPGQAPS
jgi:hypothetical protein